MRVKSHRDHSHLTGPRKFAIRWIDSYRRLVSPRLHAQCAFERSCSEFALDAFRTHSFFRASIKTSMRILSCSRHSVRSSRRDPLDRKASLVHVMRMASVLVLTFGLVLFIAGGAEAEVTPGCSASINDVSLIGRSSSDPQDAIDVKEHTGISASGQSAAPISHVRVDMEFAGFRYAVADQPTSGNTWSSSVAVDKYAKYGVGLYKVVAESAGAQPCIGSGLVNVAGNPLKTAVGVTALAMAAVGAAGALTTSASASLEARSSMDEWLDAEAEYMPDPLRICGFLLLPALILTGVAMVTTGGGSVDAGGPTARKVSWKPRITIVGLISGLFLGLGLLVLAQQYAVIYPTRNVAITFLVGGLLLSGLVLPSLFRVIAVRRLNARLRELASRVAKSGPGKDG